MKKILTLTLILAFTLLTAQTSGKAVIKFRTVTYNGAYAPRHCLSAWITTDKGAFVRTLEVKARFPNYGRYLTKWVVSSSHNIYSGSIPDAVTGASQTSHTSHTLTWDLKDYSGSIVPAGTYKVNMEFTEINGTGKYYSFSFVKSDINSIVTPADQTYFKSISVEYTAPTSIENQPEDTSLFLKNYPNPFNNSCTINFTVSNSEPVSLEIFDSKGSLVKTLVKGQIEKGEHRAVWEGKDNYGRSVSSGQYYFILRCGKQSEIKKALLLK